MKKKYRIELFLGGPGLFKVSGIEHNIVIKPSTPSSPSDKLAWDYRWKFKASKIDLLYKLLGINEWFFVKCPLLCGFPGPIDSFHKIKDSRDGPLNWLLLIKCVRWFRAIWGSSFVYKHFLLVGKYWDNVYKSFNWHRPYSCYMASEFWQTLFHL